MKKITSILFVLIISYSSQAQTSKQHNFLDATYGFGKSQSIFSLAYVKNHKLFKKQKWEAGLGLRFTNYNGSNQYYTTAPAKLTSGKTGPAVFFSDDLLQNIDSVLMPKANLNSLNLSINLAYNLSSKLSLGFNIDAIGFSFGGSKAGTYYKGNATSATTAKPTGFNLLLVSDNDLGTLNSEFFAAYKLSNKLAVKAAFQFLFTEYTTATKVQTTPDGQKNDRFRNKVPAFGIGINFSL
jgi:hypothetical protein